MRAAWQAALMKIRDRPTSMGDGFSPGVEARILAAARAIDLAGSWTELSPRIVPVLKRVHQPFLVEAAPLLMRVPPGISTGFGIDMGLAFSHVSVAMAASRRVDQATLLGTALQNLGRLVSEQPPEVQRFRHDDIDVVAIQGHGWGSALVLAPELIRPILGTRPRLLLAPVRNTLVALPDDVDQDFAADVWLTIADGAHDALDVDALRWTGMTVAAVGDASRGLTN